MIRFGATGPRSLMRTTTFRLFLRSVTLTQEPIGRLRWAAVKSNMSYGSPLAVFLFWKMRPYQEALPSCAFARWVVLWSWIRLGAPFCESGVLLPGAAPNAVANTNVAATGLSTRNIKHLSSFKLVLPDRMLKVFQSRG